jgi:hypothetical protein
MTNEVVEAPSMEPTKYYGLLYIDQLANRDANLVGGGDPIDVYLSCAALCSKAFRSMGESFCLVTNDARNVRGRLERLELGDLQVASRTFLLPVPHGLPFYSAHFKLDLFRGFASGEFGNNIGFVDLDTVLLRSLPESSALGVYDISDQVQVVYGQHRIAADIERISGKWISDARWYGGEFIAGSSSMFSAISHYVEAFWVNYIDNVGSLAHVGDEMIMSAALNCLRLDGISLVDYGKSGSIARWWTVRTRHQQLAFDAVQGAALLHLPADKVFLARQARNPFDRESFLRAFRPYVRRRCLSRRILHLSEGLLRTPKHFPPRLTGASLLK